MISYRNISGRFVQNNAGPLREKYVCIVNESKSVFTLDANTLMHVVYMYSVGQSRPTTHCYKMDNRVFFNFVHGTGDTEGGYWWNSGSTASRIYLPSLLHRMLGTI